MKFDYQFGQGISLDGTAEDLMALVSQVDGLKKLSSAQTGDYVSTVERIVELARQQNSPELASRLLSMQLPIAALPSAPASIPVSEPVRYAQPEPQFQYYQQQQQYDYPAAAPAAAPAPAHSHPQAPSTSQYYQYGQEYPTYQTQSDFNNPNFNPVAQTIETPAYTSYQTNQTALASYNSSAINMVQAKATNALKNMIGALINRLDWSLWKNPKLFWILLAVLATLLGVGVLTSPERSKLIPGNPRQAQPSPAPSNPATPVLPSPKPSVSPAPVLPGQKKPEPPKGGTGTPPVEPPSL